MLFDYRLNLENLYITQFAYLLQRTKRIALTLRTKRVLVPQVMTMSVGVKRKRPEGKIVKEPHVIPCTAKELNHVLDKWIGRKKERIRCFAELIIMSCILLRIVEPFVGFFTRNFGMEPRSSLKRNPRCKGTLYPITREREWWLW